MTTFPTALHHRLHRLARLDPDAPALASFDPNTVRLSRGELDLRAARLATVLRSYGVGIETRVAVCVERSCDLIVALLAVLKTGGAFVPLDPSLPAERLLWMARDADVRVCIVGTDDEKAVLSGLPCIDVSRALDAAVAPMEMDETHPHTAAYLIYTSGSTGTPKAVVVEQGPLAAHCDAVIAAYPMQGTDRVLHFASVSFDLAHEYWLAPLAAGASIVITGRGPLEPLAVLRLMERERVTVAAFPPAYLQAFADAAARSGAPSALRVLAFGGEAMAGERFQRVRSTFPGVRFINGYGPTETVISPMLWPIDSSEVVEGLGSAALPIGRTIGPRSARVAAAQEGEGQAGELLLGGACLARGYHGRPALTAERFIPDANGIAGARVYRTGDLVQLREDGAFDYLGRLDDQVQVRGIRVEPGEIEQALRAHPHIRDAAVLADKSHGDVRLIAFVVAHSPLDDTQWRAYMAARLPQAWIPARTIALDALPRALSGKLDRQALLALAHTPSPDATHRAPSETTAATLARIWHAIVGGAAIGLDDRFMLRGGDSIGVMQMQSAIEAEWGVQLPLTVLFDDRTLEQLATLVASSASNEAQRNPSFLDEPSAIGAEHEETEAGVHQADFIEHPASLAQRRFWVLARIGDAAHAYHIAAHWHIEGRVDLGALSRAVAALVMRHDAWRTTLAEDEDGNVVQRVYAHRDMPVEHIDLRGVDECEREARARALADEWAEVPFDLSGGPLLRAALVTMDEHRHCLMLTLHHAIGDGWSSRIVFDELARAYRAFCEGSEPAWPAVPLRYADFARRQIRWLDDGARAGQLAYWRSALADAPGALALPVDRTLPAERSLRGMRATRRLNPTVSRTIRSIARETHASTFIVLLAALHAWLYRLTGATDIVVAAPVANRRQTDVASLVGLFVNTVALRAGVVPRAAFSALLAQVRETTLRAYEHCDVPFDEVLDAVAPPVRRGTDWLRVKFAQQFVYGECVDLPGATARLTPGPDHAARFDFAIDFSDDPAGIELVAAWASDCIDDVTGRGWLDSFVALLEHAVRAPSTPVASLACHGDPSSAVLTGPSSPHEFTSVLHAFAHHAAHTPARVAVSDDLGELTFAGLDAASSAVAQALRERGIGAECAVGLGIERSVDFVVALLGTLKAGAAVVPLDPAAPLARVAQCVAACSPRCLIVAESLPSWLGLPVASIRLSDLEAQGRRSARSYVLDMKPSNADRAAYVIFTSGSTGTPKGVIVSHRALADYVQGMLATLDFEPGASMAMVSTVAADLGHTTLFGALCAGRTLHLLSPGCAFDADRFADAMRSRDVGVLKIVPSHLRALLEAQRPADVLPSHALVFGGEPLPQALAMRIRELKPGCRIINHYGPTEATVGALTLEFEAGTGPTGRPFVPTGRPLPNVRACVLDAFGAPVPTGAYGELFLGGPGLARGYASRPAVTAERFVPDPTGVAGARLYRTGDRARIGADGVIEWAGRLDDQVKIRGYRVEPAEVSAALVEIDTVMQAETLAVNDERGTRLVAFAALDSAVPGDARKIDGERLRARLAERLPDYMVPASIVVLETLPVTPNGKVDRACLRELAKAPARESAGSFDGPREGLQSALAQVWKDVLHLERVGRDENFFSLGGDSIIALQVIARSRKAGIRFTPKQLFDHPTLAQLAEVAVLDSSRAGDGNVAPKAPANERTGAEEMESTPAQHRFFALDVPNPNHWNQAVELEPQGMFDVDAFAQALGSVLSHHDAFRLRFAKESGSGGWRIWNSARAFDLLPLSVEDVHDHEDALARFDALQRGIDLARGPLVRALVATLADGSVRVFVAIHHLIVDGVSWRIVLEDLSAAYEAALDRVAVRLPVSSASTPAWAKRLKGATREFARELEYWLALGDKVAMLPRGAREAWAAAGDARWPSNETACTLVRGLDPQLTQALLTDANLAWRTQTQDLLLTALAHALGDADTGSACLVELEGHGREALFDDVDPSRTLGWLTSHYPVALPLGASLVQTLTAVKDAMRAVPNRGLGFGVLRYLGDEATRAQLAALPRPRVTFNYLGRFEAVRGERFAARFGGIGCERDPAGPMTNALAVHAFVDEARTLRVHWVYSAQVFDSETIDALAARFEDALASLVQACRDRVAAEGGGATPGDFPLAQRAGLTQATIESTRLDWRAIDDVYPLSPMQQGILFQSLLAPEQSIYVNQLIATLDAPDVERLTAAFRRTIGRHDILRTSFLAEIDPPLQVVHRRAVLPVDVLDWRDTPGADFEQWLAADRRRGFALSAAPLMRVTLIRIDEHAWRLVWTRHHLLLDGWSTAGLFAEVLRDYAQGGAAPVFRTEQGTRYRDFIAWLAARDEATDRTFWCERLARLDGPTLVAAPVLSSPADNHYGRWQAQLDASVTEAIAASARRLQVTLNTVVQAAWALTLQRMTNQRTVAFGATMAGRPDALPGVDAVLGLFINTVPVVATPAPNVRIADWLSALQRESAACAEHAHTPLFEIQRWAGRTGAALFDTLIVFENYPVDAAWSSRDGDALRFADTRNVDATDFALTLVAQAGERLTIDYGFDRARLTGERVQALHRAFVRCIEAFVADAQAPLGSVSIATGDDLALLARCNATSQVWPEPQRAPLHRQFERQAAAHPEATALLWRDEDAPRGGRTRRMTYAELDARAERVAASLRAAGARPDTPVALCLTRSAEMVVALLAVMKAGAAWLPIDADYPPARIAYMLEDARPACLVTQRALLDRMAPAVAECSVPVHCVESLESLESPRSSTEPAGQRRIDAAETAGDELAYLIYTSGSTGRPKGAGNTHRALANRIAWMQHAYALTQDDVVLQKTSFGFDVSVWEFLWPLSAGAAMALAAPGAHREPARLVDEIETLGVTTIHFVPSMLAAFLSHLESIAGTALCRSLVRIVSSGEALPGELVAKANALMPHAVVHNLYGPTEAAIDVSHWTCDPDASSGGAEVPIGMPIANMQLHVLDAALQPVPQGAIGELYLGGVGLARGYHRRPSLTAERFVPDPFAAGGRLYRTGDLATRRADGALAYLGRADQQVKLRGQRIEPGEIEAVLRMQPGIDDAIVIVREEQLIAYVVRAPSVRLDRDEVFARLQTQLPAYMVPAHLIELDALPLTPNGKCDRAALPAPATGGEFVAPAGDTERELAGIWTQVLGVERIGRHDDFFLMGGHSLLAAAAHARTNRRWSLALPLRALFEARTLERCAALIDAELSERERQGQADTFATIGALLDELEAS